MTQRPEYEVALSFAGEQRPYVEQVAAILRTAGVAVFYDDYEAVELWGHDLAVHLDEVYRTKAGCVVPFISAAYAEKAWPRHEFRSALARAVQAHEPFLLPVRFDATDLPGLSPSIAYLDARRLAPEQIAQAILQKLGRTPPAAGATPAPLPPTGAMRLPRVLPIDFNPYAEAERALEVVTRLLTERSSQLQQQGYVVNARTREHRFELRVLRQGRAVYALDVWLGDQGFGDNTLCFHDGVRLTGGGVTATGQIEWDKARGLAVVRVMNFSLLPEMGGDYRLTPEELADAVWDSVCSRIEVAER